MNCRDVDELGAAFALGAVDPEERRQIVAHLESCREPHSEVRGFLGADAALAASVDPVEPSPGLRDRIMATASSVPQEHPKASADAAAPSGADTVRTERRARASLLGWLSPGWARGLAAAGVTAAVVLALVSGGLYLRLVESEQALRAAAEAIAGGGAAFRVEGEAGRGYVVESPGTGAMLVVGELAQLPADRLYELWLIPADGAPVAVGTFEPSGEALSVVDVERDLGGFAMFAVTVEAERVDAPTGDPVLTAALDGADSPE